MSVKEFADDTVKPITLDVVDALIAIEAVRFVSFREELTAATSPAVKPSIDS